MKKLKAYWFRWYHLMRYTLKFIFGKEDKLIHMGLTEEKCYIIKKLNLQIWKTTTKIACTCGKIWYEK